LFKDVKHIAILFVLLTLMLSATAQKGKYGALAIDKSNGWYYGWAYDYNTQTEADERALKECRDRGGNCIVVKRFGAGWCAAYRTINGNVGTAYGWGVARTREEADRIATNECLKRSNGVPCSNHVWGCNSRPPKEEEEKKKDQTEQKKSDNEDDFWSNEKKNIDDNKKTGFWDGKGSEAEEKQFESQTKPPKSNQFIGDIESYGTKYLTVRCIDHGTVDGDQVSVKLNGETIRSNISLTGYYTTFEIRLKSGQNRIDFTALNEGSMSPNTAKFIIIDDKGKTISDKEWNITTNYTATLLIVTY
jgi:hypothetical protein